MERASRPRTTTRPLGRSSGASSESLLKAPGAPRLDVSAASPALSVRDLWCSFGTTQALRGVDLDVRPGEVVALLGQNGAGKSTLIKILAGVYRPTAGEVVIGEHA